MPLPFSHRSRSRATRRALTGAALLLAAAPAGATAAAAGGTQTSSSDISLNCGGPTGSTLNSFSAVFSANVPAFARPGEPVQLTGIKAVITSYAEPADAPETFSGRLRSLEVAVEGAAPSTFTINGDAASGFSGTLRPLDNWTRRGYGPMTAALPDSPVLAPSGTGLVRLRVTKLTYENVTAGGSTPATAVDCTPIPSAKPLLTLPNAAGTSGAQTIDTTVALQCTRGPGTTPSSVTLGLKGIVPATAGAGAQIPFSAASYTFRQEGPNASERPEPPYLWGNVNTFSVVADGGAAAPIQLPGGNFTGIPRTDGGYGPFPINTFSEFPFATTTGTGPVVLRVGEINYGYDSMATPNSPVPPYIPMGIVCTPVAGQPPLATIAEATTIPVNTPVVSRVYGNAWAGIGGLIRVHGSKLGGAKYVLIGTKKVRPLLVIGSGDVWVLAPPLAKGTYPVAVGTATAVSAPGTGSATTLTYR